MMELEEEEFREALIDGLNYFLYWSWITRKKCIATQNRKEYVADLRIHKYMKPYLKNLLLKKIS